MQPTRRYNYRRNLPHIQKDGPLFVTFDTYKKWELPELVRDYVLQACHKGNGWKFELHAVVVMPEHVHVLLTPLSDDRGPFAIGEIVDGIKRGSAAAINRALNRHGAVWQDEWFDHVPRRYESIAAKVYYICHNPVRRGLVEQPEDYPWLWRQPEINCGDNLKSNELRGTRACPAAAPQVWSCYNQACVR